MAQAASTRGSVPSRRHLNDRHQRWWRLKRKSESLRALRGIHVCNGAANKFKPEDVLKNFRAGLDSAAATHSFVDYADAVHSFTNAASAEVGKKINLPLAYSEKADKQS
jgi:hypothetical protein